MSGALNRPRPEADVHRNVKALFRRHAAAFFPPGLDVLEVGPDVEPSTLRVLAGYEKGRWDSVDFASRTDVPLTYRAESPYEYPIADESYDVVIASSVLEHVPRIWRWMPELARVCRAGGHVITISPVSWHYHLAPIDCWRMYPEGARALFDDAGLDVVLSEWGSVDLEWLDRITPGPARRRMLWQRLSGVFGLWNAFTRLPPEGAFDTITVGRKRARSAR